MTTASTPPSRYRPIDILHLAVWIGLAMVHVIKSTYQRLRPQPAKSLQGQVVLVTGAGHGIGRQLAFEFWRHGCTVVSVDREASNLEEGSWTAHAYTCDVTDRHQVAELANRVQQDLGKLDILVNIVPVQATFEVKQTEIVDMVNVNLLSNFWTILAFLPDMIKRKSGHIVAISSVDGLRGLGNKLPHSTTSKYATAGLMDAISEEFHLESHNIKLTCAYSYCVNTRTDLPHHLNLRIPELSPEHAASEIVNAVRHNMNTVTVPRSLLFWLNVLRMLPQDARDVWRDLFHATAVPPHPTIQVSNEGIKT